MAFEGLHELVARVRRVERRTWCEVGAVLTPPVASAIPGDQLGSRRVMVGLADGRTAECRVLNPGQGAGKGAFLPLAVGDEVLVLFPGGRSNSAIVLGGLGNATSTHPAAVTGLGNVLMHLGGNELRSADGLPSRGIVKGNFLSGLKGFVDAVMTFMGIALTDSTQSAITAGAAASFVVDPDVLSFVVAMTTSTATTDGAPPYASLTNKVTD